MRLKAFQPIGANQFDVFDSVVFCPLQQPMEVSLLLLIGRDDKLSAATIRYMSFVTIAIQHAATANTKKGFQAFRLIVEPCVNNLAGERGCAASGHTLLLQNKNLKTPES